MIKCLVWDFGKKNIIVNCIVVGGVKSDMYDKNVKEYMKDGDELSVVEIDVCILFWSLLGRVGMLEDIVGVVVLLVSDEVGWIIG